MGGILKRRSVISAVLLLLVLSDMDGWGAAIRDLGELNQNPLSYVRASDADLLLLPQARQREWNAISDEIAFLPWHQTVPRHTLEQVTWGFKEYGEKTGYGKDGRRHPAEKGVCRRRQFSDCRRRFHDSVRSASGRNFFAGGN